MLDHVISDFKLHICDLTDDIDIFRRQFIYNIHIYVSWLMFTYMVMFFNVDGYVFYFNLTGTYKN